MKKERDRAFRRAQKSRFKNKARGIAKEFFRDSRRSRTEVDDLAEDWARHNADNRQPCSCMMCGNPRSTLDEPTVQELRENEDWEDLDDGVEIIDR